MIAEKAERKLIKFWVINTLILFLVISIQSVCEKYGSRFFEAYAWFALVTVPPLSVIGAIISSGKKLEGFTLVVNRRFFNVSYLLSILYWPVIWAVIILQPYLFYKWEILSFPLLNLSLLILAPIQGLLLINLCMMLSSRKLINV